MKEVVSKKLPTVGQGQTPVSSTTGGSGRGSSDTCAAVEPGGPPWNATSQTAEDSLLETSSGRGTHPAEQQQGMSTVENSAAQEAADSWASGQGGEARVAESQTKKEPKTARKVRDVKDVSTPRPPLSSRLRRRSAPPPTALSDGAQRTPRSLADPRLPKLLMDIESHFRRVERMLPMDAGGWLRETAQLELFQEELQWILQQHPEEASDASPSSRTDEPAEPVVSEAAGGVDASPLSATPAPEKDLDAALQQLQHCEREHAFLQQILGYDDVMFREERLQEIRQVEENIGYEQRRVRHMEAENRKRERNLARAAARAVSTFSAEGDGNLRAMRSAEQLESESAVWQVKNESLQKQVLQLSINTKQDAEKLDQLHLKLQALREKLDTEEAKLWIEEQRRLEEERWNEEQRLAAEVRALQDKRVFEEQACKRSHAEKLKRLADLRKQIPQLEPRLVHLEAAEKQLRRQLRQLSRARRPSEEGTVAEIPGVVHASAASASGDASQALDLTVAATLAQHAETLGGVSEEAERAVLTSLAQHARERGATAGDGPEAEKANEREPSSTTNVGHVAETLAEYVLTGKEDRERSGDRPVESTLPPKESDVKASDDLSADVDTYRPGQKGFCN